MARKATLKSVQGGRKTNNPVIKKVIKLHEENPNMSYQAIGDAVGRDKSTVWRALKRYGIEKKKTEQFKADRADILAGTNQRIIEKLNNDLDKIVVKNAKDFKDLTTGFGIITDKERLERGQSTENHALAGIVQILDREQRKKPEEMEND
jgi:predicted transcriptional regulator